MGDTTILVSEETRKSLALLKLQKDLRSYDETINFLLDQVGIML